MIAWIAQIEYYFYIEIVKERKNMLHESELEKKIQVTDVDINFESIYEKDYVGFWNSSRSY